MRAVSVLVRGDRAQRHGYDAEWANKLHRALDRRARLEGHVCLTDDPRGLASWIQAVDIGRWWRENRLRRGWWAKVKLFDPAIFEYGERLLYSDLDNLVVGDLGPLVEEARDFFFSAAPMTAPNFRRHDDEMSRRFSSAFMIWTHGLAEQAYLQWRPEMSKRFYGDQDWLGRALHGEHVLGRRWFARGTRVLRGRSTHDARVIFCTRAKNLDFLKERPDMAEHWR